MSNKIYKYNRAGFRTNIKNMSYSGIILVFILSLATIENNKVEGLLGIGGSILTLFLVNTLLANYIIFDFNTGIIKDGSREIRINEIQTIEKRNSVDYDSKNNSTYTYHIRYTTMGISGDLSFTDSVSRDQGYMLIMKVNNMS